MEDTKPDVRSHGMAKNNEAAIDMSKTGVQTLNKPRASIPRALGYREHCSRSWGSETDGTCKKTPPRGVRGDVTCGLTGSDLTLKWPKSGEF